MKNYIIAFFTIILIGCSHGPKITVCSSFPATESLNCATADGPAPSVPYAQATTYAFYAQDGAHSFLDYCESNTSAGTIPPQFSKCSIDLINQGFNCVAQICEINGFNNGVICSPGAKSFVAYADSINYVSFSAADNQTLLDYCNVSVQN